MTKVLFIAYHFPPVGGAGVQRTQKFVQYLPPEGFVPIIVTGPGQGGDRWTPRDETLMTDIPASSSVYRVESPVPPADGRFRSRLEYWLGLPSSFSRWWIRSASEVALTAGADANLIFATMSPFDSAVVGSSVSKRLGIPWVADLRDPWALDEMQIYATRLHRNREAAKMQKLLSSAALIVMNTPEAAKAVREAFPGLDNKEILTITNGADQDDFATQMVPRADGKFRIVHSGYLHTDSGLRLRDRSFNRLLGGADPGVDILTRSHAVLLQAVERWCLQRPEITRDLDIVFVGETSRADRAFANHSTGASLTRFTGYLPHKESIELVRTADVLFLPMHNLPPGKRSRIVPGKTYEYMASGRPILAAVPDGDARDFLNRCGTALICRPDDATQMVQILDRVYTAWRNKEAIVRSNEEFVNQFERRKLTHSLAVAFHSVLAREEIRGRNAVSHRARPIQESRV